MIVVLWRKIHDLKAELQKGGPPQAWGGGGGGGALVFNLFTSTVQKPVPLGTEPCPQEAPKKYLQAGFLYKQMKWKTLKIQFNYQAHSIQGGFGSELK